MNKWSAVYDQDLDTSQFLTWLQRESQKWREHSFPPEHRTASLQALGVCEEAGELAHAILKMEQGIRGTKSKHMAEAEDAIGDIVIYLAGLCTSLNMSLHHCVARAWIEVCRRDWAEHKETGLASDQDSYEKGLDPLPGGEMPRASENPMQSAAERDLGPGA